MLGGGGGWVRERGDPDEVWFGREGWVRRTGPAEQGRVAPRGVVQCEAVQCGAVQRETSQGGAVQGAGAKVSFSC